MIKGIDAQVMTNRAAEYSKDVSAMLRRDEVANEFAGRLNRMTAEQEIKTVVQSEKAEGSRIKREEEKEKKKDGGRRERGGKGGGAQQRSMGYAVGPNDHDLPIGTSKDAPLLDIEV